MSPILSRRVLLSSLLLSFTAWTFTACSSRRAGFEARFIEIASGIPEPYGDSKPNQEEPIVLIPIDRTELCQEARDPCRGAPCYEGTECIRKSDYEFSCGACPEGMLGDGVRCSWPRLIEINEVDYDQPGADDAEFIELINRGEESAEMSGLVIELVNGDNYQVYRRIPLDPLGELGPGEIGLIANASLELPPGVPAIRISASGFIQNGPDAIVVLDEDGRQLDAIVYGGALEGFSAEVHAAEEDLGVGSLIRTEPGALFVWGCAESPGLPNLVTCER